METLVLMLGQNSTDIGPAMTCLLSACPNLTAILCEQTAHGGQLWKALGQVPLRSLKSFAVPMSMGMYESDEDVSTAMTLNACNLEQISVSFVLDVNVQMLIMRLCRQLRAVEVCLLKVGIPRFLDLLQSMPQMNELSLQRVGDKQFNVLFEQKELLLNVKKLSVTTCPYLPMTSSRWTGPWQPFARLLREFPLMNYVKLDDCHFCRVSRHLELIVKKMTASDVDSILKACGGGVTCLTVCMVDATCADVMTRIGERLGKHLESLTLREFTPAEAVLLLKKCPNLKSIKTMSSPVTDALVNQLEKSCQLLENVRFQAAAHKKKSTVTDMAMEALFSACSQLREVQMQRVPNISFRTLQAIVNHRLLHLRKFALSESKIGAEDVAMFGLLAKAQFLIPVPAICDFEVGKCFMDFHCNLIKDEGGGNLRLNVNMGGMSLRMVNTGDLFA